MITGITNIALPAPPKYLLDRALEIYHQNYSSPDLYYEHENSTLRCIESKESFEWIKKHISDDFYTAGIQTVERGDYGPHIDRTPSGKIRYFGLMYVIKSGGAYTSFYRSDRFQIDEIKENTLWTLTKKDLTQIDRFRFQEGSWNLINNQCLHSVDGLTSTRICFVISWIDPRPKSLVKLGLI